MQPTRLNYIALPASLARHYTHASPSETSFSHLTLHRTSRFFCIRDALPSSPFPFFANERLIFQRSEYLFDFNRWDNSGALIGGRSLESGRFPIIDNPGR